MEIWQVLAICGVGFIILEMFTKETKGCMRPFNYDARNIQGGNFSEYTQGVFDLYYNSLHAFEYPINCTNLLGVSNVYRYEQKTAKK